MTILLYSVRIFLLLVENKNSSRTVNKTVKNILDDGEAINLTDSNFQFSVQARYMGELIDVFSIPHLVTASMDQYYEHRPTQKVNKIPIPLEK